MCVVEHLYKPSINVYTHIFKHILNQHVCLCLFFSALIKILCKIATRTFLCSLHFAVALYFFYFILMSCHLFWIRLGC